MSSPPASQRNFGLDCLRCIAIGGVVFAHAASFIYPWAPGVRFPGGWTLHLYHFGHAGSMGVELFFVLSGYLIGGLLIRQGARLSHAGQLHRFYVRRWFRTLPNYYVFLAINLLWFGTWHALPAYLVFLQNLTGNHLSFFPESWSLSIEEWFYLAFPFATWLLLRLRWPFDRAFLTAGGVLYAFSTLLRIAYAVQPANDWANVMREVVLLRFDALMTGIFFAWLSYRRPAWFHHHVGIKALAGLALFGFCYGTLYWDGAHNESFFARTFRFNLFSLGLASVFPFAASQTCATAWVWRPIDRLARWSYAMYFINLPLMILLMRRIFPRTQTSAGQGWAAFACLIFGTIALAALWYELIEKRATAVRERFAGSPTAQAPARP